jgi:hypothetical protein
VSQDFAFPHHLVRGLGLASIGGDANAMSISTVPGRTAGNVSTSSGPGVTGLTWANWDEAMGAWWWDANPGSQPPQPGVQGQWIRLTNNQGLGAWVWYPTPAGVPQFLGPGTLGGSLPKLSKRQAATQTALAVWSTFKPKIGGGAAKWHQTEQNYWVAMDPWKAYILNSLVSQGLVNTKTSGMGLGAAPAGRPTVADSRPGRWTFYSPWWALIYDSYYYPLSLSEDVNGPTSSGPTSNGHWVRPTQQPGGGWGGMPWIWYPLPGQKFIVQGKRVSTQPSPGAVQTIQGYWVGGTVTPRVAPGRAGSRI